MLYSGGLIISELQRFAMLLHSCFVLQSYDFLMQNKENNVNFLFRTMAGVFVFQC